MAEILEDGSEILHYDIPDYPVSIKHNFIPANCVITDISIHWHEEIEITYVVSGSVNHYLNGKKVKISAGEAIFINSKQLHLIEADHTDCELYCLIFHPMLLCSSNYIAHKYVTPIVENEEVDYFFLKESDQAHKAVLDVIVEIERLYGTADYEMQAMKLLHEIWLSLYGILPRVEGDKAHSNEDLHKVQKMLTVIHKCYSDALGLEDICKAGDVGKTKGTHIFGQYLNMTPIEYLNNYRMEVAAQMLIKTQDSVTDIALATGFSDSSYFARVFRKREGMSPLEYRETMKET